MSLGRHQVGGTLHPTPFNQKMWKKACAKAGIPYRAVKNTRSTFICMMLDAGENMGWVSNIAHGTFFGALKIFFSIGASRGFSRFGWNVFLMKLKNAFRLAQRSFWVDCLAPLMRSIGNGRISSAVMVSSSRLPYWFRNGLVTYS